MSGGLYSRIKTWGPTDTVIGTDLNSEFDNVLNNFIPQMLSGYSTNVSQMQTQTNPGAIGTESLATALSGELERIRFQLAAITGNTYWYSSPTTTLVALNSALGATVSANSVSSGRVSANSSQPLFLVPSGTTNSVTLKATTTPFVYKIAGISYTISADQTITGLTVAPSTNNTCTVNDPPIAGGVSSNLYGENGSVITVNNMGSAVSALVGQIAAFKTAGSEYLICRVESTTQLNQIYRGYFFQSTDALFSRATMSNGDTLTLMKLTWVYANSSLGVTVGYTNPRYSGTAPSSPSIGDYWFDTGTNVWKTYNGTSWTASNSTLIGVCIQNTTLTIGARSFDFFKSYSDLDTIELVKESSTEVRARFSGGQLNVYGTALKYDKDIQRWNVSTDLDTGAVAASSTYYCYLKETGSPVISLIAPFDMRLDRRGFYHPAEAYRCVGYFRTDGSSNVQDVESFYINDASTAVPALTAAVTNLSPSPYNSQGKIRHWNMDASGGSFTQMLPPPSQTKGQRLVYIKTDNTCNSVTYQAYGASILSTTATTTYNSTTLSVLASTTGLVSGQAYLISGAGIPFGTTVVWTSGTTAVLSQVASASAATVPVVFAYAPNVTAVSNPRSGINGSFSVAAYTPNESYEFFSDGNCYTIMAHQCATPVYDGQAITLTSSGAGVVRGTVAAGAEHFWYWREGSRLAFRYEYTQTGAGTAGVGAYIWTLPNSFTMDSTVVNNAASTTNGTGTTIGYGTISNTTSLVGNNSMGLVVRPWSTTAFYLIESPKTASAADGFTMNIVGGSAVGSVENRYALSNANIIISLTGSVQMSGWLG